MSFSSRLTPLKARASVTTDHAGDVPMAPGSAPKRVSPVSLESSGGKRSAKRRKSPRIATGEVGGPVRRGSRGTADRRLDSIATGKEALTSSCKDTGGVNGGLDEDAQSVCL